MEALIIHLACCAFMTGLIWTIQILQYPSFLLIPDASFKNFHSKHSNIISYIVGPIMLCELVTAVLLIPIHKIFWMNLAALLLTWACTVFLSIPMHNKLAVSKNVEVINKLVSTNWTRTLLWSLRLACLIVYIVLVFRGTDVSIHS